MAGIKVKLTKSIAGRSYDHKATLAGLGLYKLGQERILPDTPATIGACEKLKHMVSWERVSQSPVKRPRPQAKAHKAAPVEG